MGFTCRFLAGSAFLGSWRLAMSGVALEPYRLLDLWYDLSLEPKAVNPRP